MSTPVINTDSFLYILSLLVTLYATLGGIVPVVNAIKNFFSLKGWRVNLVAASLATTMAVILGFVQGKLDFDSFTLQNISATAIVIYGLAAIQYEKWRRQNAEETVVVNVIAPKEEFEGYISALSSSAEDIGAFVSAVKEVMQKRKAEGVTSTTNPATQSTYSPYK